VLPYIKQYFDIDDADILDLRNKKNQLLEQDYKDFLISINVINDPKNFFIARRLATASAPIGFVELIKKLPKPLTVNFVIVRNDSLLLAERKKFFQENRATINTTVKNSRNNPLYRLLGIIHTTSKDLDSIIEEASAEQKLAFVDFAKVFTKTDFEPVNDILSISKIYIP
jgi:hypothetical protein